MNMSRGFLHCAIPCALGFALFVAPAFSQTRTKPVGVGREHNARYVPNRYILFLQDAPVVARFSSRDQLQPAAVGYRRQLEARQQTVIRDLASRHIEVAGSVATVMNAVFVVASPDRLVELSSIPGVVGVMPERRVRPNLNKAVALSKGPEAWGQAAIGGQSNAGKGIKIGILDSGIDQKHPAFDDTGYTAPTGFPKCNLDPKGQQSDCTNFTNKKVIVARSYVSMIGAGTDSSNPAADSMPDDFSARDHDGHGTAVAAAAAGGQNSAGVVPFSGMAPKAFLGSYKIFGSPGVATSAPESVIIKALNDAVSDGMDVINISSGVPAFTGALDDVQCGNVAGKACDPLASAFETAAKAGVVITVSAGNSGSDPYQYYGQAYPYFNSIQSPATAPSVIAVGATLNSHVFNPSVSVNAGSAPASLKNMPAAMSDYYFFPSYLGANSGSLVDVTTLGDDGLACSALPAGSLKDKYALIKRGTCPFVDKAANAGNAGALGIIFYMADSSEPLTLEVFDTFVGPVVMLSLANGTALKSYLANNPGAAVTIDTAGTEQAITSLVSTLASYSSFGPTPDGKIKPDMVATGGYDYWQFPDPNDYYLPAPNGFYTAAQSYDPNGNLYSSNGYVAANGTSFAAPLVAGAAALVKQAHPTWTPEQIKSALVNYSAQDVTTDDFSLPVDVEWMGAGRLDASAAVASSVTVSPSTLSFGFLKTGVTLPKSITVTVKGTAGVTLNVAVVAGAATSSATVATDQKTVTIAANGSATFNVTLSGTVPVAGSYNGVVNVTSTSPAVSLHIPYLFIVGDGATPNVVPLYGTDYYGVVNADLGPVPIQVVDLYGVPVVGQSVTFTANTRGSVIFKPVPGVPGSVGFDVIPFVPSTCTPSTSNTSVTCKTDSYGIAWVELVGGANPIDYYNPATVSVAALGQSLSILVSLVPAPKLDKVTDAGAFGATIAPGSYVSLFGSDLMDSNFLFNTTGDSANATFSNGRLPLTVDNVTVSFDAAASGNLPALSVPGYVYYVSPTQVNVYAPWELKDYTSVKMKTTFSGYIRSNVVTVPVANYAPAFLMYGSGDVFIADAVDGVNCPAPYIIGIGCPVTRGKSIQLYVNGLGPVTNQPASGDPAPSDAAHLAQTTTLPVVKIGGVEATVQFAGLAPGFVGLYQVNAVVPTGIGTGNQTITIAIGGKTSPDSVTGGTTTYKIVLPVK